MTYLRTTISWSEFGYERLIKPYQGKNLSKYVEKLCLIGWESQTNKTGEYARDLVDLEQENRDLRQKIKKKNTRILDLIEQRDEFKKKYHNKKNITETVVELGGNKWNPQ